MELLSYFALLSVHDVRILLVSTASVSVEIHAMMVSEEVSMFLLC